MGIKKNHTSEYKAKVALSALKEDKTMSELSSTYGVHPVQIGMWKKKVTRGLHQVFEGEVVTKRQDNEQKALVERLYAKIGAIEMENDWLKKKLGI